MHSILNRQAHNPLTGLRFVLELGLSYRHLLRDYCRSILKHEPSQIITKAMRQDMQQLVTYARQSFTYKQPKLIISPDPTDNRFRHPHWHEKRHFTIIMQAYLLLTKHLQALANTAPYTGRDKKQIKFCTDLLLETLCPQNFLLTNPEVIRYTKQNHGRNLLKGFNYFLEDLERWQGHINLTKTNLDAFKVGVNLATTPGKVVFRNEIIELIYYQPTTPMLHSIPMLMITSWINKFYILDLKPRNSLIKWAIDQGLPVFAISWVNPQTKHQDMGLDHYVEHGVLKAVDIIKSICQCSQVHALGYCLGGTLLAISAAYAAQQQDQSFASLSYVATLTDFDEGGGIGNLMGPEQLKVYEKTLAQHHLWDGHKMQIGFNLTNSNQFIWPFVQRRYLFGKSNVAIDSIFWGLDLANTTEALYRFYTQDLHHHNKLATANALTVLGEPINLHLITVPTCCIAFDQDTISPWQTCYALAQHYQHSPCPATFILGQGTHITGLIAHAQQKQAQYRLGIASQPTPSTWYHYSNTTSQSWWYAWLNWLNSHFDDRNNATKLGYDQAPMLTNTPGDYVHQACKHDHQEPHMV